MTQLNRLLDKMQVYCAVMIQLNRLLDKMQVYCAETGWCKRLMKVYAAEGRDFKKIIKNMKIPKFNLLYSFYNDPDTNMYLKFAKNILVDSGAFTLQSKKISQNDADKYFKKYCKYIEQNHENPIIQGFFELDIQNSIGYNQVLDYRKELFEITDKIIPVWHKSEGIKEYKKMCNDYDYIGITSVSDREVKKDSYPKFVKYAHMNNTKIHGLGLLKKKVLLKVPFDSVDGTSWFRIARYGSRNNKKINSDYIYNHQYELTYIELLEHIRFQEKMYKHWIHYHKD